MTNTLHNASRQLIVPTIDIFIKSYHKDYWLLYYALKSITKNVTGYNNIILLIPETEKDLFDTRNMPERTLIHYVKEYGNGYMFQQWCKVNAHSYSDADYILFGDSDCMFDHKIDLQDFIKDGKPEILYTSYDQLPDAVIWKEPTEKFIKQPILYEYMRRNCLIYHRSTLVNIAAYAPNLQFIIMGSERFSEFNAIGAYAWYYEKEKYNFVNTDNWEYTRPKSLQVWSHASKEPGASELHLREFIRTLETLLNVFGV